MIGVISTTPFKPSAGEMLKLIFKVLGEEYELVHINSSNYADLDRFDKVLVCCDKDKDLWKIYFPGTRKFSGLRLMQIWNDVYNKPFYYTTHPNVASSSTDIYVNIVNDIAYVCKTPATKMSMPPIPDYTLIDNVQLLRMMIDDVYSINPDYLVCDIETTGYSIVEDFIRMVGIASTPHRIYIITRQLMHNKSAMAILKEFMENPDLNWCGQNCNQFDRVFMRAHLDIDIDFKFDTMYAHYVMNEQLGDNKLDDLVAIYEFQQSWKSMLGDDEDRYAKVPDEQLANYLALDLHFSHKLVNVINEEMKQEGKLENVHDNIMIPASAMLGRSKQRGIKVDRNYLQELNVVQTNKINELQAELNDLVGKEINVNSWQQVQKVLYTDMKLEKQPGINSSAACTDTVALTKLFHPVADKILMLRHYLDINSSFVVGLLEKVELDGFIRPNFKLHGTQTGRLSCSTPNMQQIPSSHHDWWCDDFNIKNAFIAAPGKVFIEADYSQLELRIAGWYSQDEFLLDAYNNDRDIHTMVASISYAVPIEEVTKNLRQAAKKIDFACVYQSGAATVAEQIMLATKQPCTELTASKALSRLRSYMPGFNRWTEDISHFAIEHKYVEMPTGRRRHFPYITKSNAHEVIRQAINTPIQGLSSDLGLTAAVDLEREFNPKEAWVDILVHDSILCEVDEDKVSTYAPLIKQIMEDRTSIIEYRLPIKVEMKYGKRYGSLEALNV